MGAGQSTRSKRRTAASIKNLPQAYKNCLAKSKKCLDDSYLSQQHYNELQQKCMDDSYHSQQRYEQLLKKYNGLQHNFDHLTYNDLKLPSVPKKLHNFDSSVPKYGGKKTLRKRMNI